MSDQTASRDGHHRHDGQDRWVHYEITRGDVLRYASHNRARRMAETRRARPLRILMTLALVLGAVFVVLAGVITVIEGGFAWVGPTFGNPLVVLLLQILAAVAALYGALYVATPYIAVWAAARRRDILGPRRVRVGDDGVHVVTPNLTSVVAWSGLREVVEDDAAVYLFLDRAQALIVPARAFADPEQRRAFVTTCRQRVCAPPM